VGGVVQVADVIARDKFKRLDRVTANAGGAHILRSCSKTATVVGFSRDPHCFRLRRDGVQEPECWHIKFWEKSMAHDPEIAAAVAGLRDGLMGDTPRTDEMVKHGALYAGPRAAIELCQKLERELGAAHKRIAELEMQLELAAHDAQYPRD
jgi:hypothetical protein